jgi:transcriptional regulator with XRE-family HTH domain
MAAKQTEGEARQSCMGMVFWLILKEKSKEYPGVKEFLQKIGMSSASYSQLQRGLGNPTLHTVSRTAAALGLSEWDMLGIDEKVMRAWLAGRNIDLEKVNEVVDSQRRAQQLSNEGFSLAPKPAPGPAPEGPVAAKAKAQSAPATKPATKKRATRTKKK